MSVESYVLDTNTIIRLLRKVPDPCVSAHFNKAVLEGSVIIIPQIVHYEMLRGFFYADAKVQEAAYRLFCSRYQVGRLTDATWESAAVLYSSLRKRGWIVNDADILIGTFCIENDHILVTANTKDFENMSKLKLVDWTK
jgi:tRNA(fMet)-specific endonuclease VapC